LKMQVIWSKILELMVTLPSVVLLETINIKIIQVWKLNYKQWLPIQMWQKQQDQIMINSSCLPVMVSGIASLMKNVSSVFKRKLINTSQDSLIKVTFPGP
jgi:hypothetical protein